MEKVRCDVPRVALAALLGIAYPSVLAGQQPCVIPVSVLAPQMSALPEAQARAVTAQWRRHEELSKGLHASWDWNSDSEPLNFLGGPEAAPLPRWVAVGGLPASAFVARDKGRPVDVLTLMTASAPRRVVFVVENGNEMPAAAREAEVAVIRAILSKARPGDSFALVTAMGPRIELPFGTKKRALERAASVLASPTRGKHARRSVLGGVIEAAAWLEPAHPGDSIFVLALRLGRGRRRSLSRVRAALTTGRIRVFGFQFGWIYPPGQLPPEDSCSDAELGLGCVDTIPRTVWDQLFSLCRASGGVAAYENMEGGGANRSAGHASRGW